MLVDEVLEKAVVSMESGHANLNNNKIVTNYTTVYSEMLFLRRSDRDALKKGSLGLIDDILFSI